MKPPSGVSTIVTAGLTSSSPIHGINNAVPVLVDVLVDGRLFKSKDLRNKGNLIAFVTANIADPTE